MDRAKYFFRVVPFSMEGGKVSLVDVHDPGQRNELDAWLGTVVSLADGQHTLQELIDYLASQYQEGAPDGLDKTIESVIDRLVQIEVIRLSDEAIPLPVYLSLPVEAQDVEEMKQLMISDGYIKH